MSCAYMNGCMPEEVAEFDRKYLMTINYRDLISCITLRNTILRGCSQRDKYNSYSGYDHKASEYR